MIRVTYAVCSEWRGKPLCRALCASRAEAEALMAGLRETDAAGTRHWIAELGPEAAFIGHLYDLPPR